MAEPQITEISSYLASKLPVDGVAEGEATDAWRSTLRYARQTGTVDEITALIEASEPADDTLREHCASLRGDEGPTR